MDAKQLENRLDELQAQVDALQFMLIHAIDANPTALPKIISAIDGQNVSMAARMDVTPRERAAYDYLVSWRKNFPRRVA